MFLQTLILLQLSSYASTSPPEHSTIQLLNFDTLSPPSGSPTASPFYPPPESYSKLTFTYLSVFDPEDPALRNIIVPADHNCAVSKPNALLGARIRGDGSPKAWLGLPGEKDENATIHEGDASSFERGSANGRIEDHVQSQTGVVGFDILGLLIKPLAAPPGDELIRVNLRGWKAQAKNTTRDLEERELESKVASKDHVDWHMDFPVGYDLPLNVTTLAKDGFEGLRKVEIWADYGPAELDWEFCLDDLKVRVWEKETAEGEGQGLEL